jgi:Tfp pilus assembly protein FimT
MVEVIAVVALLGVIAAAAGWAMTEQVQRSSRDGAVGQLAYADRIARLRARYLGNECTLRIDLDEQTVTRFEHRRDHSPRRGTGLNVPVRCRIDRVLTAGLKDAAHPAQPLGRAGRYDEGTVEIVYSRSGRSATYALRLVTAEQPVWIVVSGLTGQVTVRDHEEQVDNLFALLATGRPDAD